MREYIRVRDFFSHGLSQFFALFFSLLGPIQAIEANAERFNTHRSKKMLGDVINGYGLHPEQKKSLTALASMLEALFPKEFPQEVEGANEKDRQNSFVNALRPFCDRGPTSTVAHTPGPLLLQKAFKENPLVFDRFVRNAFVDSDDIFVKTLKNNTSKISPKDELILVIPGGHLMRQAMREDIARDVIEELGKKGAKLSAVVFVPGVRHLYQDEIKMILDNPGQFPGLHEKLSNKSKVNHDTKTTNDDIYKTIEKAQILTETDISSVGLEIFSQDKNLEGKVFLLESIIHEELYPDGQQKLDRATTRDNAMALAEWILAKHKKDKENRSLKVVLCIDLPFRERMKNVFESIIRLKLDIPVLATNGTKDTKEKMLSFVNKHENFKFVLVNQTYSLAREKSDLDQISDIFQLRAHKEKDHKIPENKEESYAPTYP